MTRPRLLGATGLLFALALSGCAALPRDWLDATRPASARAAAAAPARGPGYDLIPIDAEVARLSRSEPEATIPAEFLGAAPEDYARLAKGEDLSITVWEKADKPKGGLFVPSGARSASLQTAKIDELGQLYLPYAGFVEAAGKTVSQLRRTIRERLADRTSDLQIEIRREGEGGRSASIQGMVETGGVYPLSSETDSLLRLIARAGGASDRSERLTVTLRRGTLAARLPLSELYRVTGRDLALRDGDAVILERDARAFTVMGAVGAPGRREFSGPTMTLIEALALGGGLGDGRAAPRAVYVLRAEEAERLARYRDKRLRPEADSRLDADAAGVQTTALDDATLKPGLYRVAYQLDLADPEALFYAKAFQIRADDLIFATQAAPGRGVLPAEAPWASGR